MRKDPSSSSWLLSSSSPLWAVGLRAWVSCWLTAGQQACVSCHVGLLSITVGPQAFNREYLLAKWVKILWNTITIMIFAKVTGSIQNQEQKFHRAWIPGSKNLGGYLWMCLPPKGFRFLINFIVTKKMVIKVLFSFSSFLFPLIHLSCCKADVTASSEVGIAGTHDETHDCLHHSAYYNLHVISTKKFHQKLESEYVSW